MDILYKMIMVSAMDDISGKKFSLQDWVMKRAANQTAGLSEESAPQVEAEQASSFHNTVREQEEAPMRAVSNGTYARSGGPRFSIKDFEDTEAGAVSSAGETSPAVDDDNKKSPSVQLPPSVEDAVKEALTDLVKTTASNAVQPAAPAPAANPVQQLQIVRLLSELGDRLRQSEKEREILWKELDICRKQISEMEWMGEKSEKAFLSLEGHMKERDGSVEDIIGKQKSLEEQLAQQTEALQKSSEENAKLQDKIASIETAAGSAIVRVEDALMENTKLAKRVEALGQDKARLMRKLEVVEETLNHTQETLKAKALVLLTDQALATRTQAPQVPAWTGNDTLKTASGHVDNMHNNTGGPLGDIASSLDKGEAPVRRSNVIFALLIVGAVVAGYFLAQANIGQVSLWPADVPTALSTESSPVADEAAQPAAQDTSAVIAAADDQQQLMDQIAEMANKIEPATARDPGMLADDEAAPQSAPSSDIVEGAYPEEFAAAQKAEDEAAAQFRKDQLARGDKVKVTADKKLPVAMKPIETSALAGDARAQHDLATLYISGADGLKVDYVRAAKWLEEAAFRDVANAQYNLGVLYHQGLGVSKDIPHAMALYRVAASEGHPEAMYNLAIAYAEGIGTGYNAQIAAVYFQKSAAGGVVDAAYNLGLLHENGLLGESQPDEAVFWYTLAAQGGNKDAQKSLDALKKQLGMSDEDAGHIVARIAKGKPEFMAVGGKITLPVRKDPGSWSAGNSDAGQKNLDTGSGVSGATGEDSLTVQIGEQLAQRGLFDISSGANDSDALGRAISAYQKSNNLKVDGKPTEDLLVHMLAARAQDGPVPLVP